MPVSDLLSSPPEQDYIILGALKSPGRAYIKNLGSPRSWDVPKAYGASGANIVFTGAPPVKFEVDIELWLPSHSIDWAVFAKLLTIPKGRITTGIGVYHPLLKVPPIEVIDVVVEDVSQFVQQDEGSHICTIKFIEWRKPTEALSRPIAAIPAFSKPLPTATDAVQAEVAAKIATIADLNK